MSRVLLLAALAFGGAACEVRAEVTVTVADDGSGTVEVALGLDDAALDRQPDAFPALDLSGLDEAGWEVDGPEERDGYTWLRATHGYGAPEELGRLVDQVAGEGGPLRDFRLVRDDEFAETRYRFSGTVDFSAGPLPADPALAEALGSEPVDLLEERLGGDIDDAVAVQVAVRLPGDIESNAPAQASGGAVWRPSIVGPEPVQLEASSSLARTERWVWLGVAVVAGSALLVYVLVRIVGGRPRGDPTTRA